MVHLDFWLLITIRYSLYLGCSANSFLALAHLYLQLNSSFYDSHQIYSPGLAYMNFIRKSTDGSSIIFILLDLSGGVGSYAQMAVQSIDQDSWVNFYGNIGKTLLSLICVSFDLLFICQHYVLYPSKKALISPKMITNKEDLEPLVSSDNHLPSV
ncbi:putative lysosomal cystine transporter [Rosa chinensis]|uniref:Putative lysosomal cystine transporter n=1 Tax=Rosa chinensis TaxID=74649 RepID=A0A2P6RK38_ROSCH|nr:putative lysosomal cystine transporter [Rosa chinensis]